MKTVVLIVSLMFCSFVSFGQTENDSTEMKEFKIEEIEFPGTTYYGIKHSLKFTEITSELYAETYGKLGAFCGKNEIQMAGMPVAFELNVNMEDSSMVLMPAFPVVVGDKEIELTDGIEQIDVSICNAVVVHYYGPYEGMELAFKQARAYIKEKGYTSSSVMDEFVTDPTTVESMDQALTKIYFFLD